MYKLSLTVFLSFALFITNAQEIKVPTEAKSFVLKGYQVLDYVTGDINGDKKTDAILVLKQSGEDTATLDTAAARPLLLLIRQANGKLKQVARNDKAIMCRQCGGVMGDPYHGIEITATGFVLSFYGGSSWRWATAYWLKYKAAKKNWYLVKESQTSFHAGDPEKTTKELTIEETELGEVVFEDVDNGYQYEESQWKVRAVKAYFYDNPKLRSTPRKGYLVKGNLATGSRELNNFVEISFVDNKDNITTGFILKRKLEKVNKKQTP